MFHRNAVTLCACCCVPSYPANYVNQINMSNMEMDDGVGRSYRYYNGTTVFPFGWGLSLTTFAQSLTSGPGAQVGCRPCTQ